MSFTSGPYAQHAQRVLQDNEESVPLNTQIAYARKGQEFLSFCDKIYGNKCSDEVSVRTVTEEKLFAFLFYQAYRSVRGRGLFGKILLNLTFSYFKTGLTLVHKGVRR